jgi:hypothetical protein
LKNEQDGVFLDKDKMMDNVQKHNRGLDIGTDIAVPILG